MPKTCDISFSDPDDLLNFKLVICPDEVRTHPADTQALAGPGPVLRRETGLSCQALQDAL